MVKARSVDLPDRETEEELPDSPGFLPPTETGDFFLVAFPLETYKVLRDACEKHNLTFTQGLQRAIGDLLKAPEEED